MDSKTAVLRSKDVERARLEISNKIRRARRVGVVPRPGHGDQDGFGETRRG